MTKSAVEWTDMVRHDTFSGIDIEKKKNEWDNDYDCYYLKLGQTVYCIEENPDDGYRSSAEGPFLVNDYKIKNVFNPVWVRVEFIEKTYGRYNDKDEFLEIRDHRTDKIILRIGTENLNDYYPSFVAEFIPENISHETTH